MPAARPDFTALFSPYRIPKHLQGRRKGPLQVEYLEMFLLGATTLSKDIPLSPVCEEHRNRPSCGWAVLPEGLGVLRRRNWCFLTKIFGHTVPVFSQGTAKGWLQLVHGSQHRLSQKRCHQCWGTREQGIVHSTEM